VSGHREVEHLGGGKPSLRPASGLTRHDSPPCPGVGDIGEIEVMPWWSEVLNDRRHDCRA